MFALTFYPVFSSCLPKTDINTIKLTVLSATKIRGCVEYLNTQMKYLAY